jgi:hypothetical protein
MIDVSFVLDRRHRDAGLRLIEPDDHFLWLMHDDGLVAVFGQAATVEAIRDIANDYIFCLRSRLRARRDVGRLPCSAVSNTNGRINHQSVHTRLNIGSQ